MLSAFFSSAETSFMAVSKIRIKTLAEEENSRRAQLVQKLLDNNEQLLSTILVGNNLVNIAASSLTTSFVISIFGNEGIGVALATGFVTLMILIFGEITPKTLASNNAEKFVLAFAPIISFFRIVFMPIVFILNVFTHIMMKAFGDLSSTGPTVTQEDLKTIVNVSHEEGVLEDDERKMLHNIFAFGETEIKEIMTPRIHVEDVKDDISYDELIDFLKNCQFSRIPVYRNEDSDDIVGVLNIKDLLLADVDQEQFDIKNYMREPYFVYEFNQISDVFESMRKDHVTLAVVLDEYGVMSGIVSLEDIVEEIVGEIDDEYDQEDDDVVALADNQFLLDGSLDIDEVNEECGTSFESEEFESIGGLVLGAVGGVPEINQKVVIDNGLFVIEKIEKNRIETLRLTVMEDEKQDT
ncbi:hemolysin-like protein [Kandleria vitulina DSM 20405]|uniref:Hemolysin-like protein n=3 Tax=Kandleria vitulina TaxID=1630 RepID=A0A0R2HD06_9FIRM|nr:hemolysin-like protein [Kandleria vitulina DSM 20405]